MKQKLPIDRIDLWKNIQALKKNIRKIIKIILKKTPRWKRGAVRAGWRILFELLSETPYKKGFDFFVHIVSLNAATTSLLIINAQQKQPKLATGGIFTLAPGNYSASLEYGSTIKPKRFIKKGKLIKITPSDVKLYVALESAINQLKEKKS